MSRPIIIPPAPCPSPEQTAYPTSSDQILAEVLRDLQAHNTVLLTDLQRFQSFCAQSIDTINQVRSILSRIGFPAAGNNQIAVVGGKQMKYSLSQTKWEVNAVWSRLGGLIGACNQRRMELEERIQSVRRQSEKWVATSSDEVYFDGIHKGSSVGSEVEASDTNSDASTSLAAATTRVVPSASGSEESLFSPHLMNNAMQTGAKTGTMADNEIASLTSLVDKEQSDDEEIVMEDRGLSQALRADGFTSKSMLSSRPAIGAVLTSCSNTVQTDDLLLRSNNNDPPVGLTRSHSAVGNLEILQISQSPGQSHTSKHFNHCLPIGSAINKTRANLLARSLQKAMHSNPLNVNSLLDSEVDLDFPVLQLPPKVVEPVQSRETTNFSAVNCTDLVHYTGEISQLEDGKSAEHDDIPGSPKMNAAARYSRSSNISAESAETYNECSDLDDLALIFTFKANGIETTIKVAPGQKRRVYLDMDDYQTGRAQIVQ